MAAKKNRRARAVASASVLVVALAFVVTSVWQIADAVFGHAAPPKPPSAEEAACSARLRTMEAALERGALAAAPAADESHALAAFDGALAPEWNDQASAENQCASSPRAKEAWAALVRLRRGLEGTARKDAHEIGPLRRDFETRLP
ncbi:MAG TPA: hypothetical protein VGH28_07875 [Polyangiaceae bacterium]